MQKLTKNIGYEIAVCTNTTAASGYRFADAVGAEFVQTVEELCRHSRVDYVDVCRMPNFRLPAVELCATAQKHVLVQKPMATNVDTARRMMMVAQKAAIQLGVMSQHLQKAGLPAPFNPYRYNRSAE